MTKKIVKKRKIKIGNFLILLVSLLVIVFLVYFFITIPTKNILIKNTKYLNDDYVLELSDLKDYPSFLLTSSSSIKKKLLSDPYIKSVKVKRRFFNTFVITIDEVEPLFYNSNNNKYVFTGGVKISEDSINSNFRVPRLINYVPDKKYKQFIKKMSLVKSNILGKMSDIEYVPNDYDKDRFLVYMDDGNAVYLTLTKFKQINYYNDVVEQLEGRKGILYLDSGNHFEIKQ